jgi:CTP:molybdopterin cytidylyltransferase MocA
VECGLNWIEEHFHPNSDADWLLTPADHPAVDAGVVRRLRAARADRPERSIFVPVCDGKRGHPLLLTWRHVPAIRALPTGVGLNVYLREQSGETVEVRVENSGMLRDLDTPEDYERMQQPHTFSDASQKRSGD